MAQVECPKCHSFKTSSDKKIVIILGVLMLIGGVLLGVFVFPLVFIPIGILLILVGSLSKAKKYTCFQCQYKFPNPNLIPKTKA